MLRSQTLTDLIMILPQLESAQVVLVDQEPTFKFNLKVHIPILLKWIVLQK